MQSSSSGSILISHAELMISHALIWDSLGIESYAVASLTGLIHISYLTLETQTE